jgi:hypothetical protein
MEKQITAEKLNDFTLQVTIQEPTPVPVTPEPVVKTYDRRFLEQQLIDIQTQWDSQVESLENQINSINIQQQANIDEVKSLLKLCDENNIILEVKEEVKEVEPVEEVKEVLQEEKSML